MMVRTALSALFSSLAVLAPLAPAPAVSADDGAAPSFVPEMTLAYIDPASGDRIECADGCRRFEVPAGVELEARVQVHNILGQWPDGVSWDLWLDQNRHPFPGLDAADCRDADEGRVDVACWQALVNRVDWQEWQALGADLVCIPDDGVGCTDVTVRVPLDPDYLGSRGQGVYSFALWVDRYRVAAESDIFDNFAGPVRVRVVPAAVETDRGEDQAPAAPAGEKAPLDGSAGRPYVVLILRQVAEASFTLGSVRSRGGLEFEPAYPGLVSVEVQQVGTWENMTVEVRKVSTGEILAETRGKGRLQLDGHITHAQLMDDRRLEVVVTPAQGSRGVRGTATVTYPGRATYRSTR